jgi:hypothetical protein
MSNDIARTGRVGLIAIAHRMLELAKLPPKEQTPRTRAESLSDHMNALLRYARGYEQMPEPTRDAAQAMFDSYYLLLDENRRLRAEVGAQRGYARMMRFVQECPALEQWRKQILDGPRRSPLERAGAWELTSILEELAGNGLDAEFARIYAAEAIESAPTKPTKQSEVAA